MADSIQKDQYGPDWPLGLIVVATPGTPVGIMSLVDPSSASSPNASGATSGLAFSPNAWEVIVTPAKKGGSHGTQANTGNIYIVRQGNLGAGNHDDYGSIVAVVRPTDPPFRLTSNSQNRNSFGPYRYFIDADNASDGAVVTLIIQ